MVDVLYVYHNVLIYPHLFTWCHTLKVCLYLFLLHVAALFFDWDDSANEKVPTTFRLIMFLKGFPARFDAPSEGQNLLLSF